MVWGWVNSSTASSRPSPRVYFLTPDPNTSNQWEEWTSLQFFVWKETKSKAFLCCPNPCFLGDRPALNPFIHHIFLPRQTLLLYIKLHYWAGCKWANSCRVVCKCRERVVCEHLSTLVADKLDPLQFACKAQRGVEDVCLTLLDTLSPLIPTPTLYLWTPPLLIRWTYTLCIAASLSYRSTQSIKNVLAG